MGSPYGFLGLENKFKVGLTLFLFSLSPCSYSHTGGKSIEDRLGLLFIAVTRDNRKTSGVQCVAVAANKGLSPAKESVRKKTRLFPEFQC